MSGRYELAGKTAVITGAGGGIGRAIAVSLARRGCNLALADINEAGMEETAHALSGVRVTCHRLDVTDRVAIAAFPSEIATMHPGVDLLVNNAGVALAGTFEQLSEAEYEWLIDINFWGVVRMTRAFLPTLHRSGDAWITNLSSLFGLVAPPGQSAYSASKFAVRGFSESLRHELASSGIGITVVHPGGVRTSIASSARQADAMPLAQHEKQKASFQRMLRLPPERAGEIIVQAIEQRRARVLVGTDAKITSLIERLAPVSYWKLLRRTA